MTLLVETITDHRATSDVDLTPPMIAALVANNIADVLWFCNVSPNDRYAAAYNNSHSGDGSMLWVADIENLQVVYNINLGTQVFDEALLPDVSTLDTHLPIIDDIGSVWTVDGGTTGKVVEILKDNPTNPQYRFTLASGGGGDSDEFRIARAFTMPDATIRVLFVKQSVSSGAVHGWHLWDNSASTYSHDVVAWSPKCTFQDELGDIWICGVDNDLAAANTTAITTAYFQRLTNITSASPYTTPISFTGLPDLAGSTDTTAIWGGIANGYFVGGWLNAIVTMDGAATPMTGICNYLLKLNLEDNTDKTIVDISATAEPGLAWAMPDGFIPPDQGAIALTYSDITKRKFGFFNVDDLSLVQTYNLADWNAGGATDNGPLDDNIAYVGAYLYTREAFIAQSSGGPTDFDADENQQWGKLWLYYTGVVTGDDTDSEPTDDSPIIRVWGFSLDGHDFYVLRLGPSQSLIYDLMTGQWAEWATPNRDNWRAHCGQNWVGMSSTTFANGFGSDVVAGDDVSGTLWILDPNSGIDDRSTTGSDAFTRMVIGGIPMAGRDTLPCGAVQLTCSLGNPALTGASITLRTSDDFGNNYVDHGSVTVNAGAFDQVVEWRALGIIRQPGRVFELSDNGAAVRISGLDLR